MKKTSGFPEIIPDVSGKARIKIQFFSLLKVVKKREKSEKDMDFGDGQISISWDNNTVLAWVSFKIRHVAKLPLSILLRGPTPGWQE